MYYDPVKTGARIRKARMEMKCTQQEMAVKLGTAANYLSELERGIKTPSIDMFIEMAETFGVTLDYLILGVPMKSTEAVKQELGFIAKQFASLEELL